MLRVKRELYDEIVAHATETPDDEVCGLVAARGGDVAAVYRCANADLDDRWGAGASFSIDPRQQIEVLETIERDGHELAAIYHSHPHISPVPSSIDEHYARFWPGVLWIIVGVPARQWRWSRSRLSWRTGVLEDDHEEPVDVWTWRIEDGRVYTAELEVY